MNKERLQNYNEILIENNVSLENINNTIKELPDVSEMIEKFEINDASYLFYNGARLDNLDSILKLCKKLTSTRNMFRDCKNITDLNLNCIDTSLVSDMLSMFESCNNLVNLDISNFDFSSVVAAQNMFDSCSKLISTGIKKFKLPLNQTMYHMFYNCRELIDIDFSECESPNLTDISYAFYSCYKLKKLDLSKLNTYKLKTIYACFTNSPIVDLDLSGLHADVLTNISSIGLSRLLTNLIFLHDLGKGFSQKSSNYSYYTLDLSMCVLLTYESIMDVLSKLYDLNLTYNVAGGGTLYTQQIRIGSTNMGKLSADEIAIATNKGWVVS